MITDRESHTNFRLALLEFGDGEEQRRHNWNTYCLAKFGPSPNRINRDDVMAGIWQRLGISGYSGDDIRRLRRFAAGFGGFSDPEKNHPDDRPGFRMDFVGVEFPQDVSFAGRLLIGPDFRKAEFGQAADFDETEFLGSSNFTGARFLTKSRNMAGEVSFHGSTFHSVAVFENIRFPATTNFEQVTFRDGVWFNGAEFVQSGRKSPPPYALVHFGRSVFEKVADFSEVDFGVGAEFQNVEFKGETIFDNAAFRFTASFNNSRFRGAASFRQASFSEPPGFFESELHEDVDFSDVDWNGAERSRSRRFRRGERQASIRNNAAYAVRAWDRLALIMSRQEKFSERHEFFRLKMRAQRQRDGASLLTTANWLFDMTSDFGWGVGRALFWWLGHILAGAIALAATVAAGSGTDMGAWPAVWNGLLVSVANSLAFLRLGSEGGYLNGPHETIMNAVGQMEWAFATVGAIQAVLGPVLLFLVLLTLRNRFRLG